MAHQLPPIIPFADPFGNAFLLPNTKGFTAVDVGSPATARRIIRYVATLGRPPQSIHSATATHLHSDHTGGLHELQRLTHCTIVLHRQARRRMHSAGERLWLH